ncbi:MAG TPA: methionine--tRNA ligase [Acidimicrobiales bacterium]|nr:methionine--tRNA ligase [Acidimicrobiales bacterium]
MADPFYLTTPIYYVNDAPHVGHAYATVNADAISRWHRLLGDDVFFLTGTDEHGLKVAQSAEQAGVTPLEQADRNAAHFQEAWDLLDISHDDFIRTTEPRHHAAVQALLGQIHERGDIELDTYEGPYCVSCEAYYTEAELVEGRCPVHPSKPITILEEENYFFRLSRYTDRLVEWLGQDPSPVQPDAKRNEVLGFIRQGLEDVSITRTSLDWGVPVPWAPGHVFYVWYDALINYATAIGFGTDEERFERWWPAAHHLIGKEIIRFHCVYWPAMLMAAGIDPPHHVRVHGWLLLGGEKLSKTEHGPARLTEISPARLVDDFGVDGVRYHLLRDVTLGADGDFSYEAMLARHNADLANNLGNLLSRVATVVGKKCDGRGPAPDPASPLAAVAAEAYAATADAWDRFQPSEALDATWRLIREANAHLEANEPWKADPGPAVDAVLGDALEVLRIVAVLATPAMPSTCREVWRRIGLDGDPADERVPASATWGGYPGGLPVEKGAPLFPRLTSA